MSKKKILEKISAKKEEIKKFDVKRIGLFGSYVRETPSKKSDVDVLVEFKRKTFDNYMNLKFFLEKLLRAKVDLVITEALKPQLKPLVLREVVYAKGI